MKIRVLTHSGIDKVLEVLEYNPIEISETINDSGKPTIVLGNSVYSTIDIKLVEPVEQVNEDIPQG